MKDIRITDQYTPGSLQNTIFLESERPNIDTPLAEPDPEYGSEDRAELVDFYITPPAVASIRSIVGWTKVLIFSMAVLALVEMLMLAITVLLTRNVSIPIFLAMLRSVLSTGFFVWLIILSVQFIKTMRNALKTNDTEILSEAFRVQTTYFKWAFLNIVVTVSYAIFEGLF